MKEMSGPELRRDYGVKREEPVAARLLVRPQFVSDLLARVEKFRKIAARHGQEVSAEKLGEVLIDHPVFGKKRKQLREEWLVQVPPMVGVKGRIIGHFEQAEDGKSQYVHVFSEAERAACEALLPRAGQCDHCHKHRQRVKSFVVEHEGEVRIVGSNCLMDFLGIDPAWALAVAEWFEPGESGEQEERWGGLRSHHVELMAVVEAAYKAGKKHGGYPAGEDRYWFRNEVSVLVFGGFSEEARRIKKEYEGFKPEPLDVQALADYVEHAKGDFGRNLQIAFEQDFIHHKRMALVIAGVAMWVGRSLQRKEEAAKAPKQPPKAFSEAPKSRIDFEAEVVRAIPRLGNYGEMLILGLRCEDGRQAVIFHSGQQKPEAGKRYKVRASVVRHQDGFKGWGRESVLNRAVFEEIAGQADDNHQRDWSY